MNLRAANATKSRYGSSSGRREKACLVSQASQPAQVLQSLESRELLESLEQLEQLECPVVQVHPESHASQAQAPDHVSHA